MDKRVPVPPTIIRELVTYRDRMSYLEKYEQLKKQLANSRISTANIVMDVFLYAFNYNLNSQMTADLLALVRTSRKDGGAMIAYVLKELNNENTR